MTNLRTLIIEVDLPQRECSPNSTAHWRLKYEAKQRAKTEARIEGLRAAKKAKLTTALNSPVTLTAEFYMCRGKYSYIHYHPRDEDNAIASLKASIDGLTESGAICGDAAKNLKIGGVRLYSKANEHQGRSCVVITLTEAAVPNA